MLLNILGWVHPGKAHVDLLFVGAQGSMAFIQDFWIITFLWARFWDSVVLILDVFTKACFPYPCLKGTVGAALHWSRLSLLNDGNAFRATVNLMGNDKLANEVPVFAASCLLAVSGLSTDDGLMLCWMQPCSTSFTLRTFPLQQGTGTTWRNTGACATNT